MQISTLSYRGRLIKTLVLMKLTLLLVLLFCFNASASLYAQKITIHEKNARLDKILTQLEKQSNYTFIYENSLLDKTPRITVSIKEATLNQALDICLDGQPLTYAIVDKTVIIKAKEKSLIQKVKSIINLPQAIKGKVTDTAGTPLPGATITIRNKQLSSTTSENGEFLIQASPGDEVAVSFLGYTPYLFIVNDDMPYLTIVLRIASNALSEVAVVSTGYQEIPKERATGSFGFIDNKLFNRSVSTSILDRIENVTAGLLFNHGDAGGTDPILIRGRSTIYSSAAPLIVLDNFPYDGDIRNINPNDIENISVLKDAAAASIWGARSGNGVIVITTKKGKSNSPKIEFNTYTTLIEKPDLHNISTISSADYIELEKFLFDKGYYDGQANNVRRPALSPVVEILFAKKAGTLPAGDADRKIEQFKQYDIRDDYSRYLYRVGINQQHALSISGLSPKMNYYISAGYDKNLPVEKSNNYQRVSIRSRNIYKATDKLTFSASVNISMTSNLNDIGGTSFPFQSSGKNLYPYARLKDDSGNNSPLYLDLRQGFVQQAQNSGLLNWQFNPLDNQGHETITTAQNDNALQTGVNYKLFNGLTLDAKYQYENVTGKTTTLYDADSYYSRNLINNFTQLDAAGNLTYPVPMGGRVIFRNDKLTSHQGRLQLNFSKTWNDKVHQLDAMAGYEVKSVEGTSVGNHFYGYNEGKSVAATSINYTTSFRQYGRTQSLRISDYANISGTTDHFLSYFANAAYNFKERYTLSGSIRRDETNLFGVSTNQKGTPLWSVGGAWSIASEPFYHVQLLPQLRLRTTYGYQGNTSRVASAYTTAIYDISSLTGLPTANIQNPPNPSLRWERTRMLNIGLDFGLKNDILTGSLEYYNKKATDLLGYAPLDPTLVGTFQYGGEAIFFGNVAEIKGRGIDITLNAKILNRKLKWNSTFLFSYASSKVSKYTLPESGASAYMSASFINPVEGRPVFSVYSYPWSGLNPENGNPRGYINGAISEDYISIVNNTPIDSVVYHGSSQPTVFGAFRNTFIYKNFQLSFNISYKTGYYMRKASVNYTDLFSRWTGSGDYAARWQKPGDEISTNVPSLLYPANNYRDNFYTNAEPLVIKADNIRFEDLSVSYDFKMKKGVLNSIRLYLYASNLGTLWLANKDKIDPYYPQTVSRLGRSLSLGVNLTL